LRASYNEEQLPVIKRGNRLSILPVPTTTAKDLLDRLGPLH
jgi:predicted RNA-binding protein with PUA-like domain